ncbi:MAG: hypothetical protein A4S14_11705 [Proteobacteria bacterium SG_bin9]|nr:MAG: hypothetical protein A4S14_11705 [Proteobacteria bacterium SG_bin9]
MKHITVALVSTTILFAFGSTAGAQGSQDYICGSKKTLAECVTCSRNARINPGWTEAGMKRWCENNMPRFRNYKPG